jgi:uncharacterized protein
MDPNSHPHVQQVLAYLAAAGRQDFAAAAQFFTDDFRYTVPGRNPLAGSFTGKNAALDYFGKLMQASQGSYKIEEMVDWLVSDSRVMLIARESVARAGKTHAWTRYIVFRVAGKKFSEVVLLEDDQYAYDAFWQ